MPSERPSGKKSKSLFWRVLRTVRNWGTWLAILAFFVCYALLWLHVLENHHVLTVVGSLVVVGLAELLFELRSATEEVAANTEALLTSPRGRLLALVDCQRDLEELFKSVKPKDTVHIDHLGLDMEHAWDYMKKLIREHGNLADTTLHLLMLSGDEEAIKPLAKEARKWCKNAREAFETIKGDVQNLAKDLGPGRRLRMHVRLYSEHPSVHGFRVAQPDSMRMWYFSFCRFAGTNSCDFSWGEHSYRTIRPGPTDPVERDEVAMFDGQFEHLWNAAAQDTFAFDSKPPDPPAGKSRRVQQTDAGPPR